MSDLCIQYTRCYELDAEEIFTALWEEAKSLEARFAAHVEACGCELQ